MSLADRLAALSPQQRELLRRRLAERGREGDLDGDLPDRTAASAEGAEMRIPRRAADAELPLSYAQERLWFLNHLERDSAFYNIPMALRLRGQLDVDAMRRAVNAVVERHEVLRTSFSADGGVPHQVVHDELAPGFELIDHAEVAPDERARVLERVTREHASRPFDLANGPLVHLTIVRFADDDHGLLLSIHHIVGDGWSRGVIMGELEQLYRAFTARQPSPLPPLEIQYGDFAVWQRRWLSGERFESEMRFWEERLAGLRELRLPTDRPRRPDTVHQGAKLLLVHPPELLERVKRFSAQARVTPFMTLLAVFKVLLQRLCAEDDVVVGVPTANRNWPATEPLVGFFVNSLVMRTDLGGDPSFSELLNRIRQTTLGAFEHRNVPFERVVERLRPDRVLGRNPLFQVTFQYQDGSYGRQNSLTPQHDFPGLTIERLAVDTGTALFDLSVNMGEIDEGLGVLVEYSTALWDEGRIDGLMRQFTTLLEDAMARPEVPLHALTWLDGQDLDRADTFACQSLRAGEATPLGKPVHLRVFDHARSHPGMAAVVDADGVTLSYGELVSGALALASALIAAGVGDEDVVVVCLPRGPAIALAPLAVLMAGAAYLPLDPADPVRRRRATIIDAGASLVLTVERQLADFMGIEVGDDTVPVLDVAPYAGRCGADITPSPDYAAPTSVHAEQLAYVVYTSGSTGRPKGVGVSHRALTHLVAWQEAHWPIGPGQRGTSLAGLAFDAIVWELWMTLATGGTLVLPADELRLDPPALAAWLVTQQINVLFAPTPVAERLLDEPALKASEHLRALLVGGDKLTRRPSPSLRFAYVNCYGPAENAVVSSSRQVVPATQGGVEAPPIGNPLPGVVARVLDPSLRPVPVGAPGELCLGGRGLARGYRGRAALTASRFVPDPWATTPGERLYRTGDRVRYLADGQLEFLGRTDHQVKIRGARLEPGEIEATLLAHPQVRETTVLPVDRAGQRALVAFFVAEQSATEGDRVRREATHVDDWRRLYDTAYGGEREAEDARDARFDLVGWHSSYNGKPIPREEMRAWVDETVARIRELAPRQVLEIGVGTGLLLYRLAPHVERYVGLDFSEQAVNRVREELARPGGGIDGVQVHLAPADQAATLVDARSVDTVVVNSVAQYFPSIAYLESVLDGAISRVRPGGRVFVGDLRAADLDRAFYANVALARTAADESIAQLALRAEEAAAREDELLVAPAFFHALAARQPRIRGVRMRPKRFDAANELAQFRYDVVLELDEPSVAAAEDLCYRSFDEFADLQGLAAWMAERPTGQAVVIGALPNARVAMAQRVGEELFAPAASDGRSDDAAALARRAAASVAEAIDPGVLWSLGERHGARVDVRLAAAGDGTLELHLGATGTAPLATSSAHVDLAVYGRAPAQDTSAGELAGDLRDYLEARLPRYMVPERFVAVTAMPTTSRGKLDRRRLLALDPGRGSSETSYVAPRNELEAIVAASFAQVLSVDRVGIADDFFDLGGHSLLATRVIADLEEKLGFTIELRTLFQATTVTDLADVLGTLGNRGGDAGSIPDGGTTASGADAATAAALGSRAPSIPRHERGDDPVPASFGQRRLWLLEQLLPGTAVYHMPARVTLRGPLDVTQLRAALDSLLARHEPLRSGLLARASASSEKDVETTIRRLSSAGEASGSDRVAPALDVVQVVAAPMPMPFEFVDLASIPEQHERTVRAEELAAAAAAKPFDLTSPPLARALLIRLSERCHELIVTLHHAAADGWSVGIMLRELAITYARRGSTGEAAESALGRLPISYSDYAVWQRRYASNDEDVAWWRETLQGAPARLALPTDRARPPVPSFRGERVPVSLDSGVLATLDELALRHRATRFMVALAAWQVVLRRMCDEQDLVIVSPLAGRRRPETHGLVGFFVNSVPLRVQAKEEATFEELLEATRSTSLAAFDHAELPFEVIVEAARRDRDLEAAPFAQVAFALQNTPGGVLQVDDLEIAVEPLDTGTAKTDLSLLLDDPSSALGEQRGLGLTGVLEFSSELFERSTALAIARAFEETVATATADPAQTVAALAARLSLPTSRDAPGATTVPASSAVLGADRDASNLSDNQLLVWTGHRLDPTLPLHLLAITVEIEQALDEARFQRAFAALVEGSDAMRACVVERDGVPQLLVSEPSEVELAVLDLSELDDHQFAQRVRELAFEPLDITQRTYRSVLIRRAPERFTWLIVQHQIVCDGESMQLIVEGVSRRYRLLGEPSGDPARLTLPPYLEHLAWEREQRLSGALDDHRAHWEQLLRNRPEPPRFYGSTGIKHGLNARRVDVPLASPIATALDEALVQLSKRPRPHPVMRLRLFLALLVAFLNRTAGVEAVVVGMPWRNRGRRTARGTLGLFMRVVPVAMTVSGRDTLASLFERTGPAVKEALRHGEQVVRNPVDAPLYDVVLNLHTAKAGEFAGGAVESRWLHTGLGLESLSVQLSDFSEKGQLSLAIELHEDVYDVEHGELMARHFCTLMAQSAAAPSRRLDALALETRAGEEPAVPTLPPLPRGLQVPSTAESSLVATSAAGNAVAEPNAASDGHVLAEFRARVAAAPDSPAIALGQRTVSYAELDGHAQVVARELLAAGVVRGDVIALVLERGATVIAAMLGVLRAGAAFMVIEGTTPTERREQMLAQADVKLLLVAENDSSTPADPGDRKVVECPDLDAAAVPVAVATGAPGAGLALPRVDRLDAAYVAFTSGSTGRPKGVVVEHGALASFARAAVTTYGFAPADRVLQFSSLAFDASIEEIFGALLAGACLVPRDAAMLVDPARFVERCAEAGVTVLDLPTAYFQQLSRTLAERGHSLPACVRLIILGGERLVPAALAPWREAVATGQPSPAIVNSYGPTETTVVVSAHLVSEEAEDPRRAEIPIGSAFGEAQLYVLDAQGAPAAVGIVGELYVGGPTVARGYAAMSGATAARFVPDHLSGRPGARLYRTGDRVRRRGDGALEYVGRVDRQVKVRGHRVELAEVERAIAAMAEVSEVAVVDITASDGVGKVLVAFVVSETRESVDLRAALGSRLPAFMVPGRWVIRQAALPQDARGKVDRRALRSLVPTQASASAPHVAPASEVEREVARCWEAALNVERVGVHDNFFELGGTSLTLVQMHPMLSERLGVSIELVDLFRFPTVQTLARHVTGMAEQDSAQVAQQRDERVSARREALERRRSRAPSTGSPSQAADADQQTRRRDDASQAQP
ncbi:MAG: amino acid adenylation domain-containing protein [Pseudomonadota bacterium]